MQQSGLSKQLDFSVTQEVLRAYGDAVKEAMKQVLWAIAAARQDEVCDRCLGAGRIRHRRFQHRTGRREEAADLGIESATLKKQVFKRLAFKYLCDARQEIKNRVAEEIDGRRVGRNQTARVRRRTGGSMEGIRHSGDRAAGGPGVREQRTGEERAGVQGGTAGRTEAAGTTGAADERTGGREQAQPEDGGGSGAQLDGPGGTAAAGSGEDRPGVQGGAGRNRARPKTGGWWRAARAAKCR